jgi:hypothetical protein
LQYYHPPTTTFLKIKFGATAYRCAACRCNFASFRPLRKKFTWRHRTRPEPVPNGPPMQAAAPEALNGADLSALAQAVGETSGRPEVEAQQEFSEPLQ